MLTKILARLRRFNSDERGLVAIESVLILPLLFWAYIATFVYFDAFRSQSMALRASYVISDSISREWGGITSTYLTQMHRMQNFLTNSQTQSQLRVSVVCWSTNKNKYRIAWSEVRGSSILTKHTDATINKQSDLLPTIPNSEQLILVESWVDFLPAFDVGISESTFQNYIFTRPRFTSQLLINNDTNKVCPN